MKIRLYQVGKDPNPMLSKYNTDLLKRIKPWARFEEQILRDRGDESFKIITKNLGDSIWVALDPNGEAWDDNHWLKTFNNARQQGLPFSFLIGGAHGIDEPTRKKCQHKVSLSPVTLSHGMAKSLFIENLYRVLSRIAGHPFHK